MELKDLLDKKREEASESGRLRIVCSNVSACNIAIFIATYASCGVAGGVALPLLGASWFGDCLRDDGKTIIVENCDADYRSYNLFVTIFWSLGGLLTFLFSGFFGRLSDSFGRRWIILLCLISHIIPRTILIFYVNFIIYFSVSIIMDVPRSVYNAVIADLFNTKPLRTVAFGLFTAMSFGIGLFIGSAITLIVSSIYNNHAVFIVIGIIYFLLIPYWYFFIKETLPKKDRKPFTTKNYNPFRPLLHIFDNPIIAYCSIHSFLYTFDDSTVLSITSGFAGDQFGMKGEFESNLIFALLALSGGIGVFIVGIVLMPLFKKYKLKNIYIMIIGDIIRMIGLYLLAISPIIYEWRFILSITATFTLGIGSMSIPARTGIASHHLYQNEQGIGLGIIASYTSIAVIISPGFMGYVYYTFTRDKGSKWYIPSMPWYILIFVKISSLLIISGPFYRLLLTQKNKKAYISTIDLRNKSKQNNYTDIDQNKQNKNENIVKSLIEMPNDTVI